MTKHLTLSLATLFVAAGLVGCGAQPGKTIVKYTKSDTGDKMTMAPGNGQVTLYGMSDASGQISYPVEKDDKIGFRDDREGTGDAMTGSVVAVAGSNETKVSQGTVFNRTYMWKYVAAGDK